MHCAVDPISERGAAERATAARGTVDCPGTIEAGDGVGLVCVPRAGNGERSSRNEAAPVASVRLGEVEDAAIVGGLRCAPEVDRVVAEATRDRNLAGREVKEEGLALVGRGSRALSLVEQRR